MTGGQPLHARRSLVVAFRACVVAAVAYYLVVPFAQRVIDGADQVVVADLRLIVFAIGLQVTALFFYSVMTRETLGDQSRTIGLGRLFGIQLATRAVTSAVPGGAAAGPALGYRLMTNAGISGRNASAGLASSAVLSAVVLNLILWFALVVSIPMYGFRPLYAAAALVGVVAMLIVAAILVAIVDGSPRFERFVARVSGWIRVDGERVNAAIRGFGQQLESIVNDRRLVSRASALASLNWLIDAASLWMFLRAFGVSLSPVGLIVAFGIANVLAAIPVSPGGIGIVEWAYLSILVTFGAGFDEAAVAVAVYRVAQLGLPVVLGVVASAGFGVESVVRRATPGAAVQRRA